VDTTYVSLDLELLDSPELGREILEIGAVRFRGDQELETLEVLVKTTAALGHRISRLTGLTEADLAGAIPLKEGLERLVRLIGSTPVVGQSIELDLEQLQRAGLRLRVPALDTFELAQLMLPGLPTYDLESIARALGVEVSVERHRALADARLAMQVFQRLAKRVASLDLDSLAQISRLAQPLDWPLKLLFGEAELRRRRALLSGDEVLLARESGASALLIAAAEPARQRDALIANQRRERLDVDALQRSMQKGGETARRIDGFEERAEQLEMLRAVAEAFNDSENLLVEAGTGTGKSLAYLLPAIHFAVANNRRVVVSTNTINLQDQLSRQELPALQEATGLPLKYCVLKGRTNYLCLRRWTVLLAGSEQSPSERSLLIKTLLWLPQTKTGDRAELRLTPREEEAWSRVAALQDACSPQHCAYHRTGRCYLAKARRAAEASHVVIVNHALLLADLSTRSRVLPEYRHLVIDEAHHLEDEATAQLGWRLGLRELVAGLERLWESGPSRSSGLIPEVAALLRRNETTADSSSVDRLCSTLGFTIGDLADELPGFFNRLRRFGAEQGQRADGGTLTVRLSAASRAQPAWSDIEIEWDQHNQRLLRLIRDLGQLLVLLETSKDRSEEWEELSGELAVQTSFWESARERLWDILADLDRSIVAWLTVGRNDEVYVNAAPLHVGEHLREGLFADKECVVLTSATLTAERSFRYVRERLGIEDARELMLGSPFDYERSALVYLPTDLPEPNSPGYQQSVERITGELIAALEGRTLVLFTSYSQLRATYQSLKAPLESRQIVLLGQRMDGASRARLLESFKNGDRVALMGTTSFWEGVDVVGEALSCLVMARLPFTTPSDPVFQARSEGFEDPFGEYAVPQAILRFRQGFGRLIRSRSDRGIVVVLDGRIRSRAYGRAFLASLPGCVVREGPGSQAARASREWLSRELESVASGE
jgi:DNA polymerase-3 subunit epsilon/ATP-dependent DNA helicase DinG